MDTKFWATAFTLTGTIIGAGILGLPYVFAKSGFLMGVFWLVVLGGIMLLANLYLGEVILRTKKNHQLTGYAKKYLGKWGSRLMFFAMVFGIYSALLAYLIGEGDSFAQIFGIMSPLLWGVVFWVVMTFLLGFGLKELKRIETWGVIAIVAIVLGIFIYFLPSVDYSHLLFFGKAHLFLPIGVVLFALLGFTSIPELKRVVGGNRKILKKAILVGTLIPVVLYILFSFIFIGILGVNVTEVATLSFGPIVTILGIFTMMTSFFVLSFSIKDMYEEDYGLSKMRSFIWTSLAPLILYILVTLFNWDSFIEVLGIGGVVSGGLTGILILAMNWKAKQKGDREPEYSVPINWFVILLLVAVFIFGVVAELVL